MLPNPLDFDRICRICLSNSENFVKLVSLREDLKCLLVSVTALSMIVDDDLPQNICAFCSHQIQSIRYFISKCQESDRKLRESIQITMDKSDEDTFQNDALNSTDFDIDEIDNNQTLSPNQDGSNATGYRTQSNPINNSKQIDDALCHIDSKASNCTTENPSNETYSHIQEISINNATNVESKPLTLKNECHVCNKKFANAINLEKHKAIHENSKSRPNSYQCTVCGKQMKHINHFKMHMRSHRNLSTNSTNPSIGTPEKKKEFLCSTCGKACTSRSNLAVHTRRHTGIMTNFCKICGKGYPRSTDLTIHMRKHTGEKPFSCSICNRSFARSDKLTIHIRVHTGEKPYLCSSCGRAFAQRNDLISHQRRKVCGHVPEQTDKSAIS